MSRVIFKLKNDDNNYVNIVAEEFHEEGEFLKAYNSHNELVAMVSTSEIRIAYITGDGN